MPSVLPKSMREDKVGAHMLVEPGGERRTDAAAIERGFT